MGDTVNYHIGKFVCPKIFTKESSLFFRRDYLIRAQEFYEKNGKKTIILARFIPIIRTFAPFVAGIGTMSYFVFLMYNIIGAVLWSALFIFGGFLFGNISWIRERFGLFIIIVIVISLTPLIKEIIAMVIAKRKNSN
ncbi:MAG: VTT domain-containing protein [Patescibacteria group bacterium]